MNVRFEQIHSVERLAEIEPQWRDLHESATTAPRFSGPSWVLAWLREFGSGLDLHAVAAWSDAGQLDALLLFEETRHRRLMVFPFREWEVLRNDHMPESGLLARPGRRAAVMARFTDWLRELPSGPELVRAAYAPETSRELAVLAADPLALHLREFVGSDYVLDVLEQWETFLAKKSRNFRGETRQAKNRAEKLGLTPEFVTRPERLEELLPELTRVSCASWQGMAGTGTFQEESSRRFYTEVARDAAARGGLWLKVLWGPDQRMAGFLLNFRSGDRVDSLKSEFDRQWEHAKPGQQLNARLYQRARESGVRAIHKGFHVTDFKTRWHTSTVPLITTWWFRPTLKARVFVTLRRGLRALRDRLRRAVERPAKQASASASA
ncbi:MAG: GNAT family N-acetyltransferase [Bdellovibrionales bacterium]|nr:GNAT family N-acetyltransferase [Bdellovibrionales bacterium]